MRKVRQIIQGVKMLGVNSLGMFYSPLSYVGGDWQDGKLEAVCGEKRSWTKWPGIPYRRHIVPDSTCECGIYAASDLHALLRYDGGINTYYCHEDIGFGKGVSHGRVVVLVTLWGKVIPYEYGYRAQHAQVAGLYKPMCSECASIDHWPRAAIYYWEYTGHNYCGNCLKRVCERLVTLSGAPLTNPVLIDTDWLNELAKRYNVPILSPTITRKGEN